MVMTNEAGGLAKKKTRGRQKIEIKKIENHSRRLVAFSKRRAGLFKKASELCVLTGVSIAIIVQSSSNRVFSFGHPSLDSVIDRFLGGGTGGVGARETRDCEGHYSDVCRELEAEKKRKEAIEKEAKRAEVYGDGRRGGGCWWADAVEGLDLEELDQYAAALEVLIKNVTTRADALMLEQNSNSLPPQAAAGLSSVSNADVEVSDDTPSSFH